VLAVTLVLAVAAVSILMARAVGTASETLRAAVESVRLAQEAEIGLLLHARATDPFVRRTLEEALRGHLDGALAHVTSRHEGRLVRRVEARIARYLERPPSASGTGRIQLERAVASLESLVDVNVAQAYAAAARAESWGTAATAIGIAAVVTIATLAASLLWWLQARVFRPTLALGTAMEAFARGDRDVRAVETGPAELRDMAGRFNEMAGTLAAQRSSQIAFLAGIAHDLRNPLATLRTSIAIVRPDAPLPDEARLRHVLGLVARQIHRLDRMVGDFLDMARIDAGALELRLEQCDLRDVVHGVTELLAAEHGAHRLQVVLPPEPAWLACDPMRLEQVVGNLISNALKYSPTETPVHVAVGMRNGGVTVAVRDRGPGIPEREQARIFEPFRRLATTPNAPAGAGIGLHVVRRIVQAHGGDVVLVSAPGAGSEFRVHLPAPPQDPARPHAAPSC
jgi:signal transduction histidine kinase